MKKSNFLTKALASVGTAMACFPILAPILIAIVFLFKQRDFLFDFLMPAELFPYVLAGGGLMLWAAWRAHSRRALIAWSLGVAVVTLVGSQLLAVATGLATGETETTGIWYVLVLVLLGVYILAAIANAVGGVLLLRDLFNQRPPTLDSSKKSTNDYTGLSQNSKP